MTGRGRALSVLGVTAILTACGGSPPPPPPPPPPRPAAAPVAPKPVVAAVQPAQPTAKPGQPATAAKPGQPPAPAKPGQPAAPAPGSPQAADALRAAGGVIAPAKPKYEVRGRRDPFENLELAVKEKEASGGFSVAATKLTGVVHGRIPLALVETSEGHGYILKPGDTLGDGRVVEIGRDSVTFAVPPKPGSPTNRLVLKLTTD